jgi:hypothetical protein
MWKTIFPLVHVNCAHCIFASEPTFLLGELLLMSLLTCAIAMSVWRMCRRADADRYSFAALVASFSGGMLIELATILNTEIGNFYHSQSTFQLFGLHEPVYMLFGCYIWLLWAPLVLARNFGAKMSATCEAAACALLAASTWGVLDSVGLGFLWWTWHTDDPLYAERTASGVPVASSFWIMSTAFSTALILRWLRDRRQFDGDASLTKLAAVAALAGPAASLALMHVPFLALYHPLVTFGQQRAALAYNVFVALCMLAIAVDVARARHRIRVGGGAMAIAVALQVAAYTGCMAWFVLAFDPGETRRTSYGQPLGTETQCAERVSESCFWGAFRRERYLCASNVVSTRDHFDLRCTTVPDTEGVDNYTLCGVAKPRAWYVYTLTQIGICLALATASAFIHVAKQSKKKSN